MATQKRRKRSASAADRTKVVFVGHTLCCTCLQGTWFITVITSRSVEGFGQLRSSFVFFLLLEPQGVYPAAIRFTFYFVRIILIARKDLETIDKHLPTFHIPAVFCRRLDCDFWPKIAHRSFIQFYVWTYQSIALSMLYPTPVHTNSIQIKFVLKFRRKTAHSGQFAVT